MSDEDDKVGYKKPPKKYQFGRPGGNKPGQTSEMRKRAIQNAAKALKMRERLLDALLKKSEGKEPEDIIALLDNAVNTLMKDAENRGLGMPTQQVDQTSSDGSMSPPTKIIINGVKPKPADD